MNKETKATETNASTIASKEGTPVVVPTDIDYEARIAELEAEKAKLVDSSANYKLAYLKESNKNKSSSKSFEDETEEERLARLVDERISESRLVEINRQQDELVKRSLKENKELRQALLNRSAGIPTSVGSHTEGKTVSDTVVTPEQEATFRKAGWDDKKIERYKKNLIKQTSRSSFF